jgi:hypothetical protein
MYVLNPSLYCQQASRIQVVGVGRRTMDRDSGRNAHYHPVMFCCTEIVISSFVRATTLIVAADKLLATGDSNTVSSYLWTNNANIHSGGAIKYDLDYIASTSVWAARTCDLWEELESSDLFWNRITTKRALLLGAQFASKVISLSRR